MSLNHRGPVILAVAALSAFFCIPPAFSQSQLDEDFDDTGKTWQEIAVQLPAPPTPEHLIPFYVSATATQTFAVDEKSLDVGKDGVIRFTLVSTSPSGAKNISYEGIRCASFEKKSYAYGRDDGSWSRSRRDQWEPIVRNAANRQHGVLAVDFFCDGKSVAGDRQTLLKRLRSNQPIMPKTGG
ncbi:MAG: CNP1-like family protein [Burkholderiaceae bacterium]